MALLLDLGARVLQVEGVVVDDRLADGLGPQLLHITIVGDLCEVRGRLQCLQFGHVVLGAQAQQDGTGRRVIAGIEIDLIDDTREFQ
jgi:hypothetical protein